MATIANDQTIAKRIQLDTGSIGRIALNRIGVYARLSEEIERLLNKGYATPSERRILEEMYLNYKAHGWNGDMDSRIEKVHTLPTKDLKH